MCTISIFFFFNVVSVIVIDVMLRLVSKFESLCDKDLFLYLLTGKQL